MFISVEDTDKIAPVIQVLGVRKDAKQRKWSVSINDVGVPQTGEQDSYFHQNVNKPSGTKNGHFVYRAQLKLGKIYSNYNGSAYYITTNVLVAGRDYEIQLGTKSFTDLMRGVLCDDIPVIDKNELVVEVNFILEKYGRYVMAEIIKDPAEWL